MRTISPPVASVELHWTYHHKRASGRSDFRLKGQLAQIHDRLALEIAHRMMAQCPMEFEDLSQICRIGLLKAIDRYNPGSGAAFSSFAVPYIQGEVQHFLRDHWGQIKIPRRAIETASKVRRVRKQLAALGREMDEDRVASGLGIPACKWQWIKEATDRKPIVPLEEGLHVPYEQEDEDTVERDRRHSDLFNHLGSLPNPYRICLIEKFFGQLDNEQIAKQQGVTVQQVQQWLEQGLNQLRQEMTA